MSTPVQPYKHRDRLPGVSNPPKTHHPISDKGVAKGGVGDVLDSIGSLDREKRSPSPLERSAKASRTSDLLSITEEQQSTFLYIYGTLATAYIPPVLKLTEESKKVDGVVHPLSFLLFLHKNSVLKGHLNKVKSGWTTMIAWNRTQSEFSTNMNARKGDELHLEAFLANIEVEKHKTVKDFIRQGQFSELLIHFLES